MTPFGKITILKTLILSRFNHLFTSVVIEKKILVDINKIFYEYLWNGKPDKISRNDVCHGWTENVQYLSWLKYISNETKPWIQLLKHTVGNLSRIPIVGGDWHCCTRKELKPFWKTVFEYWSQFCVSQHVKTNEDMSSSIWFNPNISQSNLFFPDWCKNGIYVIADIIDEEGNVCSLDKLRQRYGFHINFLNYITVRKSVKKIIGDNKIDNNFQLIRPYVPFHMKALLTSNKISKSLYTKFAQINTSRVKIETKWSLELNLECTTAMWKLIYKSCF